MLSLSKNAFSINICHCPFSQNLLKVVQICGGQYSDWSGFIFKDMAFTIFQRLPQVHTYILSPFSLIFYEINAHIYRKNYIKSRLIMRVDLHQPREPMGDWELDRAPNKCLLCFSSLFIALKSQ